MQQRTCKLVIVCTGTTLPSAEFQLQRCSHLNGGCLGRQGLDALVCPAQLLRRHAPDGAQAALLLLQPSHHVRLADDVGDVA